MKAAPGLSQHALSDIFMYVVVLVLNRLKSSAQVFVLMTKPP